jgi:hypothetical protein
LKVNFQNGAKPSRGGFFPGRKGKSMIMTIIQRRMAKKGISKPKSGLAGIVWNLLIWLDSIPISEVIRSNNSRRSNRILEDINILLRGNKP